MAERTTSGKRPGERTPPASDLAAELDTLPVKSPGTVLKIDAMFGHRPDVLASIKRAKARGVSSKTIADALSREGTYVSESAVERWTKTNR